MQGGDTKLYDFDEIVYTQVDGFRTKGALPGRSFLLPNGKFNFWKSTQFYTKLLFQPLTIENI